MTLGLAVIVGLILWQGSASRETPHPVAAFLDASATPNASDAPTLAELGRAFEKEVRARKALADRLAALEALVDPAGLPPNELLSTREDDGEANSIDGAVDSGEADLSLDGKASRFNDQALLSLGLDPSDAARLRDQWITHELNRAGLLDQSIREGWFLTARRQADLNRLDQEFRATLQDEEYDQVLYALGRPNRIRIGEVLDGSAASDAGLRRNDVLLSYDGNRIFKPMELLLNSSSGVSGEDVPIDILREGRRQTVYVSRGPLGILTEHEQGPPIRR
jgi:hypothetical protein